MTARTVALLWSGGKDSALALDRLRRAGERVVALVHNVDAATGRDRAHGVPDFVVEAQAAALGLHVRQSRSDWAGFGAAVERDLAALAAERGVDAVAFGDIRLAEHRAWNEALARRVRLEPRFPLWGEDEASVVDEVVRRGHRAVVVAVRPPLDRSFLGRWLHEESFVADVRARGASIAGEDGEYHSLVVDGPLFRRRVDVVALAPRPGEHGYEWLDVGLAPC